MSAKRLIAKNSACSEQTQDLRSVFKHQKALRVLGFNDLISDWCFQCTNYLCLISLELQRHLEAAHVN